MGTRARHESYNVFRRRAHCSALMVAISSPSPRHTCWQRLNWLLSARNSTQLLPGVPESRQRQVTLSQSRL